MDMNMNIIQRSRNPRLSNKAGFSYNLQEEKIGYIPGELALDLKFLRSQLNIISRALNKTKIKINELENNFNQQKINW
jgi:hypothetical protein